MSDKQYSTASAEGGMSILLMLAVFLIPLAMSMLFYPVPTLIGTAVALGVGTVGFLVSRKLFS